jgi:hypothetical protein
MVSAMRVRKPETILEPGRRIGRLRIQALVGRGGMREVYGAAGAGPAAAVPQKSTATDTVTQLNQAKL